MGEWVPYLQETLSTPVSLVIVGAGFLGLIIGWLIGRPSVSTEKVSQPSSQAPPELSWRHEKLILLERQEVERESRLGGFLTDLSASHGGTETDVRSRLFGLGESVRSTRGRIGADISRLTLVSERLQELKEQDAPRQEAISASIEMAGGQVVRLKAARDQLRPVSIVLIELEEKFIIQRARLSDGKQALLSQLEQVNGEISEAGADWSVLTDETDRGIRDLLSAGKEKVFEPVCQVLLVDGSVTGSLEKVGLPSLGDQVDGLLRAVKGMDAADATKPVAPLVEVKNGNVSEADSAAEENLSPDSGFRPVFPEPLINGNQDGAVVEEEPLMLFRGNNVEIWGEDIYRGANCRARKIPELPSWASWISIRRLDTGERVFSRVDSEGFAHGGNGNSSGFNATNEHFYGARHLGMFSDSCPNEVETRFTYGGWGFGHRVCALSDGPESLQASGWEGKEVPENTVFEIFLYAGLPELEESDRVLEWN
mgnify:CR=1 FL=1